MPLPTHYDTLEISRSASPDEISFAYRRKLEALTRDGKAVGSEADQLRRAFEALSNPLSRISYDAGLTPPPGSQPATSAAASADYDINGPLLPPGWKKVAAMLVGGLLVLVALRQYAVYRSAINNKATQTEIVTKATDGIAPSDPNAPPVGVLPRSPDELYAAVNNSVAKVIVKDFGGNPIATGSGVVVGPGVIVTNCHVVKDHTQIEVKFPNETSNASVQTRNDERDLCMLYAGNISAKAVPISSANGLKVGQKVFAVGSPAGLENTLSEGIVSGLRDVDGGKVIQTSAAISPGSSGGGLFDQNGNLVGITTFQHKSGQNLNFALPSDWIIRVPGGQGNSNSASFSAPAGSINTEPAKPAEPKPGELMLGKWACTGNIEALAGRWVVTPTNIEIMLDGKTTRLSYALQSDKLVLYTRPAPTQLEVEQIRENQLDFATFNGAKLSCKPQ